MMMKEKAASLTGNDRFEGYLADILRLVAASLRIDYEICLSTDGNHGEQNADGQWNGIIGQVVRGVSNCAHPYVLFTLHFRHVGRQIGTLTVAAFSMALFVTADYRPTFFVPAVKSFCRSDVFVSADKSARQKFLSTDKLENVNSALAETPTRQLCTCILTRNSDVPKNMSNWFAV